MLSKWIGGGRYLIDMLFAAQITSGKMEHVDVVHTAVFAAAAGGGNPCPVVMRADSLSDGQMLSLARHFGLDTVFVLPPERPASALSLRFFVPDHEMGISGHATVAAITVALNQGLLCCSPVRIDTINGCFDVAPQADESGFLISLDQGPLEVRRVGDPSTIARALRLPPHELVVRGDEIVSASVSRPKLLVPLRSSAALDACDPDFELLWHLCERYGVSGFYPYTRDVRRIHADLEARQFPLRAGFPEDAATGVAAAALAAWIASHEGPDGVRQRRIAQGVKMGQPSLIHTEVTMRSGRAQRTRILGKARIAGNERVSLPHA
jgi:PhzF family phenazine biosynthesis protein